MPQYGAFKIWVPVSSSNVEAISYDAASSAMRVRFKAKGKSPARTWHYPNVPVSVYQAMLAAPSKGKFVWNHLRGKYGEYEV